MDCWIQGKKEKKMRKSVSIILALFLAVMLLAVSCDSSSLKEELVSVAFDDQSSRAISASLPGFSANDYYWYYAAAKVDGSNMVTGNTPTYDCSGARAVKNDGGKGLGIVSGFSQGVWNFTLFAYKEIPTTAEARADFVYSGEVTGIMLRSTSGTSNENIVNVVVSPVSDPLKSGTLLIDIGAIMDASTQLGTITGASVGYVKIVTGSETVTPVPVADDPNYKQDSRKCTVNAVPGAYLVKVVLEAGGSSYSSSVVATVYSQLTTVVGGSIVGTVVGGN